MASTTHRYPVTCASCGQRRRHHGRGLCELCTYHHRAAGTLDQYPRVKLPRAQRLEDWEFLKSQGFTIKQAADRMGLTKKGLEKVIERARRAGVAA